jgi:hypothetical protein
VPGGEQNHGRISVQPAPRTQGSSNTFMLPRRRRLGPTQGHFKALPPLMREPLTLAPLVLEPLTFEPFTFVPLTFVPLTFVPLTLLTFEPFTFVPLTFEPFTFVPLTLIKNHFNPPHLPIINSANHSSAPLSRM